MAATLFISDLHLHPCRPAAIEAFNNLLQTHQGHADSLYILGDLFESWIGDDHPEAVYDAIKQALNACVTAGTPVYIMHGNRDFLLGDRFARDTACTLIDDPMRVELQGEPTLLMHGDSLCTDDAAYQQLRRRWRNPDWQRQTLALPVDERLQMAQEARELSTLANLDKENDLMDVNQAEVLRVFEQEAVSQMIHGHTHRPAIHTFDHGGRACKRIVLGDWYRAGSVLKADETGFELVTLPF